MIYPCILFTVNRSALMIRRAVRPSESDRIKYTNSNSKRKQSPCMSAYRTQFEWTCPFNTCHINPVLKRASEPAPGQLDAASVKDSLVLGTHPRSWMRMENRSSKLTQS